MTYQNERSNRLLKELNKIRSDYDRIGLEDPFYGTVGNSNRDLELYFKHGQQQIMGILSNVQRLGLNLTNGKALDFGCGIGRVTRALAGRFDEVHGLDISSSMIALANNYNGNLPRCHFRCHCDYQLKLYADDFFDLIVGINVFRYMLPELSQAYVREFMRTLKPGGLIYIETSEARLWRRMFPDFLLQIYRKFKDWQNVGPRYQNRYHFPETEVRAIVSEAGGQVLHVEAVAQPKHWTHVSFFVTKPGAATSEPTGSGTILSLDAF